MFDFLKGEVDFKEDGVWQRLGFLYDIDNKVKERELIKWFNKAIDFLSNPGVEYDESFQALVFPMIRRIICDPNSVTDDFSIERLYEEFTKELPDDIKIKINKTEDPEAEKLVYICKKFTNNL